MLIILTIASLGLNYFLIRSRVKKWTQLRAQTKAIMGLVANPPKPTKALQRAMRRVKDPSEFDR